MKKVYLAGFEVFYPNALEIGEQLKSICEKHGLIGIFPKDNVVDRSKHRTKREIANEVFQANISFIQEADIVVANLNSFRGVEPDSGTCFEVGYACALGKKLYGYVDDERKVWEKVASHFGGVTHQENGTITDKNNMTVENLELPLNLMLAIPSHIVYGSFEACIEQVRRDLQEQE